MYAVKKWTHEIYERFRDKKPLALTRDEEYLYQEATECWICGKTDGKPDVIAKSSEEFIAVSIKVEVNSKLKKDGNMRYYYYTLRFIDSLKFLSAPLDKLVESSKSGCTDPSENFPILNNYFLKRYELLLRKGIYPYDYFTDCSKMLEEKLPSKEVFYSKLKFSGITDEEYQHAQSVYETFNCKNLAM